MAASFFEPRGIREISAKYFQTRSGFNPSIAVDTVHLLLNAVRSLTMPGGKTLAAARPLLNSNYITAVGGAGSSGLPAFFSGVRMRTNATMTKTSVLT
jgi:hypothetical protein